MLSMTDILKAVHPSYMDLMNLSNFTWDGMVESLAKSAASQEDRDSNVRRKFYGKRG